MSTKEYHHAQVNRQLQKFASWIKRAVCVDSLDIDYSLDGKVVVTAEWQGTRSLPRPGCFAKVYDLDEVTRSCRLRRMIISDILEAREPLKD